MKYRNDPLQIEKQEQAAWLLQGIGNTLYPPQYPIVKTALAAFTLQIKGKVVYPWTTGYDQDRKDFSNAYPAWPKMIVYSACFDDIRATLALAQQFELELALRSGGHSLAGYSVCNGIVLDTSGLNSIYIDPGTSTAVIEPGCNFGKIFPLLEQYGLHMPGGGCPTVAVAGYMQGGGYGLTSRNFGMNCDSVLEITLMLADGRIVVANKQQNADLFWAVRGGTGGNFGVLLRIKYQLYSLGAMYGIKVKWAFGDNSITAAQALTAIQENYLVEGAYPNMGIEVLLATDTDGVPKVIFCATWIGAEADFAAALAPLQAVAGGDFGSMITGRYSDVNQALLEGIPNVPPDVNAYSRSAYIARPLAQEDWEAILTFFLTAPNSYAIVDLECYGGKINTISPNECAFMHRDVKMDFFCDVFFDQKSGDGQENMAWLDQFFVFLQSYTNGHSYQNYPNRNQHDFCRAFWGNYYEQLVRIKQKYDPSNFFRFQQSIGAPCPPGNDAPVYLFETDQPIQYEHY